LLGILKPITERRHARGTPAQLFEFAAREFTKPRDVGIIVPFSKAAAANQCRTRRGCSNFQRHQGLGP
jgi:hypothetical protein